MKSSEIDIDKLSVLLKENRGKRGLREVAKEIGDISAPTLSRVEQGKLPDLDSYIKICRWLKVSPESFLITNKSFDSAEETVPQKVEILLRSERTLKPETINAIMKMVDLAIKASQND